MNEFGLSATTVHLKLFPIRLEYCTLAGSVFRCDCVRSLLLYRTVVGTIIFHRQIIKGSYHLAWKTVLEKDGLN